MPNQAASNKIYDNCSIMAPDGEIIARCGNKRVEWYLRKELATLESENPTIIKLLFEPNGRGSTGDDFHMQLFDNKCVRCGTSDKLTRHHVIPRQFKKHFPDYAKNFSSHDIVPLCLDCHKEYETVAEKYRRELGEEFNIYICSDKSREEKALDIAQKSAHAILTHGAKMPPEKLSELYDIIATYLNVNMVQADMKHLIFELAYGEHDPFVHDISFGQQLVNKLGYNETALRWRKHFIKTLTPKYMPPNWDINRSLRSEDES